MWNLFVSLRLKIAKCDPILSDQTKSQFSAIVNLNNFEEMLLAYLFLQTFEW